MKRPAPRKLDNRNRLWWLAFLLVLGAIVGVMLAGCSPPQEPTIEFGSPDYGVEIRQLQYAVRDLQKESEERKAEEARLIPQLEENYERLKAMRERLEAREIRPPKVGELPGGPWPMLPTTKTEVIRPEPTPAEPAGEMSVLVREGE